MPSYLDELIKKAKEKKGKPAGLDKGEELEKKAYAEKKVVKEKVVKKEVKEKPVPEKQAFEVKETAVDERLKVLESQVMPRKKPKLEAKVAAGIPPAKPAEEKKVKKSDFEKELEGSKKIEIASYEQAKIYKIPGQALLNYSVPVPRPTASEKAVINTIKEAATRIISISPYKIRDEQQRRAVYYQRIMDILRSSPELKIPERRFSFYAQSVVREMVGYGMIDPLISDDKLEEIMVIGPKEPVYIFHREYEMMTTNIVFYSDNEIQDLVNKIARQIGRRVDISSPMLDARLPDGSRVNATIPPASVGGSTLTIRKFRKDPYTMIDLINVNTVTPEVAAFMWLCVDGLGVKPANMLIAGGTGSGKTTTLNVLASFVPAAERVITIEDTAELNLPIKHWIRLEAKPPGLEGKGEIKLDVLTKNSLRMRPDRIIVGEVRHDEAFTLFTAMNTGHAGCMGTIHSNSPQETIARVTSPPMNVPEIMLSGLDFIIVEHRIHDRKKGTIRRITEIAEVSGVLAGKARTQTIFEYDASEDKLKRTAVPSNYLRELEKFTGMGKREIENEIAKRTELLEKLAKNNIRHLDEVSKTCQKYLLSKKG